MGSVTQGTRFIYTAELTGWGQNESGATWSNSRITGETLSPNLTVTESEALRDDGQITNQIQVDASGGGEVTGELMATEWNGWLRAGILAGSYLAPGDAIDASTNNITWLVASGSGSSKTAAKVTLASSTWAALNYTQGMWIKSSSMGTTNSNVIAKIQSLDGANAYLTAVYGTITDGTDMIGTIVDVSQATNGTTITSYNIEISDQDDTDEFRAILGATVSGVRIDFPEAEKATVSFTIDSKKPTQPTSTIATGGGVTINSQATTDPMVTGDIFLFRLGDPDLGTAAGSQTLEWNDDVFSVLSGSIEYSPSLRPRRKWGTTGPAIIPGRGTIRASSNFRIYYNQSATSGRDDQGLANDALGDVTTGFVLGIKDDSGNFLIFECPRCKISSFSNNSPGKDQDVIADVSMSAYRHPSDDNPISGITGTTMRIMQGTLPS